MLKFGWSKKDVSVEGPIGMPGQFYERISEGILDPITVTALAIDDGNGASILLSCDFAALGGGIIEEIRDAVRAKNPAIAAERILANATHTHTSPRFNKMGVTAYDKAPHDKIDYMQPEIYRAFLVDRASDAVVEAYEKREEGSYAYGYGYAVVAHHRRPTYFDDLRLRSNEKVPSALYVDKFAKMYGNTNDPMFSEYEGNVDSSVYFMFTFDRDDRLTGAIVNVPCPSQNGEGETLLSAAYWAQLRAMVKEKYGDIYVLPQCACAGDMAPRPLHAREAEQRKFDLKYETLDKGALKSKCELCRRIEIAERIMVAFDDTYKWASKEKIKEAKLLHTVKNVKLPAWKITEEQYLSAKEELEKYSRIGFVETDDPKADFEQNTRHSSILTRYETIIKRYESDRDFYEPEIHVIALGDIAFVSNPFELYIAYQHRMQARSPFIQTFAVQLAAETDGRGYLCTERAAENMGYSANIYSCSVSPAGGNILVEETLKELEKLHP